jgi:hypothetical protein
VPFSAVLKLERRVSHEGMVSVGGNLYSVPDATQHADLMPELALFQKLAKGDWIEAHDNFDPVRAHRGGQKLACRCARSQGLS